MTAIKGHVCQPDTWGGPKKQDLGLLQAQGRTLWSLSLHRESHGQEPMALQRFGP